MEAFGLFRSRRLAGFQGKVLVGRKSIDPFQRSDFAETIDIVVVTFRLGIRFEWDARKAASNFQKHGVRFETASRVFADPLALFEKDRIAEGEVRFRVIGMADNAALLLVVHVVREESGGEVIRIISARKTDAHERRLYEEGNR